MECLPVEIACGNDVTSRLEAGVYCRLRTNAKANADTHCRHPHREHRSIARTACAFSRHLAKRSFKNCVLARRSGKWFASVCTPTRSLSTGREPQGRCGLPHDPPPEFPFSWRLDSALGHRTPARFGSRNQRHPVRWPARARADRVVVPGFAECVRGDACRAFPVQSFWRAPRTAEAGSPRGRRASRAMRAVCAFPDRSVCGHQSCNVSAVVLPGTPPCPPRQSSNISNPFAPAIGISPTAASPTTFRSLRASSRTGSASASLRVTGTSTKSAIPATPSRSSRCPSRSPTGSRWRTKARRRCSQGSVSSPPATPSMRSASMPKLVLRAIR